MRPKTFFFLSLTALALAAVIVFLNRFPPVVSTTLYLDNPQGSMKNVVVALPADTYAKAAQTAVEIGGSGEETDDSVEPSEALHRRRSAPVEAEEKALHPEDDEKIPDEPEDVLPEPAHHRIRISSADCVMWLRQEKAVPANYVPGVSTTGQAVASADYVPGRNTAGQAVAPADLEGGYNLPVSDLKTVTLPVAVDLEKNFPFLASSLWLGSIPIARIQIRDGQAYVNGHPLTQDTAAVLKQACLSSGE
jgi:hypothetical protein